MANAATLSRDNPVRMMVVGYPGSGKTGALAPLVNAGFKLRILDFDGNYEPLLLYSNPEKLVNVDILSFEDKLKNNGRYMEVVGIPSAFTNALNAMDKWKYKDEQGQEIDLGLSKEWGPDTIVVLDSLTSMGQASFRRALSVANKTPLNVSQNVWKLAMDEQDQFIEKLTSLSNRFHVIVLAHLVLIGPKDVAKDDADLTKELKERAANLTPTRLFPSALGQQLPPKIGGHFPTLIEAGKDFLNGKVKRVLRTIPREDLDIKVPSPNLPATLPIESGMLTIFEALSPSSVALVRGQK